MIKAYYENENMEIVFKNYEDLAFWRTHFKYKNISGKDFFNIFYSFYHLDMTSVMPFSSNCTFIYYSSYEVTVLNNQNLISS